MCRLSQFLISPTTTHLVTALHIVRYLRNALATDLFFRSNVSLTLTSFTDVDWGSCSLTRWSTIGFCFYLVSSIISWKLKKQQFVSRSSSEVEYMAIANTICEAQWLLHLLQDFSFPHSNLVTIFCDNQSVIYIITNMVFHKRTKYIEMDCHLVRDKVQDTIVHLQPIQSSKQVADIFTKTLHPGLFNSLVSKLDLINIHSSLRGVCAKIYGSLFIFSFF